MCQSSVLVLFQEHPNPNRFDSFLSVAVCLHILNLARRANVVEDWRDALKCYAVIQ